MTTLWIALVLGLSIVVNAEATEPPASQPAPASLNFPGPPPEQSGVAVGQQLDEDLRLITGNNEPDVRLIGAKRLLSAGTDEAGQRLVGVLQGTPPDLAAQIAVCQAVADLGRKAPQLVEPLLTLLGDQRAGLSDALTQALRRFDDADVINRLQLMAAHAESPIEKREAAVRVLGEMGENMSAVAALVRLASDGTGGIRQAALSAFEHATGTTHADAASAGAWWEAHKSMAPLEWSRMVGEQRVAQVRTLRERSRLLNRRLVAACRDAFVRLPSTDRPKKLAAFLSDELPEIRALGLEQVNALITDRKEVSQDVKARLVEMITDPDAGLRQKTAMIVGDLRLTEAVPKLLEVLARETDYRARAAQVSAIGRLDGMAGLPALLTCLADDATPVVEAAAQALAAACRPPPEDPQVVASIASALLSRYKLIGPGDVELRERFLEAMARVGAESFRPVFRSEIDPDRPVRVRRAAIIGLGAYGDVSAADEIRRFITSPEPEIRLAAVQAMGPCGRTMRDLEELAGRLDSTSEADPSVRDRAWESYQQVALRMPPSEWLAIADAIARPNDPVAQRRRMELLKSIIGSPQRLKQLPAQGQVGAFERLGDAQVELGDFQAAASSYEEALALVQERSSAKYATLSTRLVTVLVRSHQDRTAVQRFAELCGNGKAGRNKSEAEPLVQVMLREIRARGEGAADAATFLDVLKLLDLTAEAAPTISADLTKRLEGERNAVVTRRSGVIDRLLDGIGNDPQTEAKLLGFGRDLVLPKVLARLSNWPTTTPTSGAAVENAEERLIHLARVWVEQWPGYAPGTPREERVKSLNLLKELSSANGTPTTSPAA